MGNIRHIIDNKIVIRMQMQINVWLYGISMRSIKQEVDGVNNLKYTLRNRTLLPAQDHLWKT
jgi:hypothetical protein